MIVSVNIDTELIEGIVKFEMPKHLERMDLLKKISYKDSDIDASVDQAKAISELVISRVKEIDLKHKFSDLKFNSIDDIEMYSDGVQVIYSIGTYILNGLPLGNGSKPS